MVGDAWLRVSGGWCVESYNADKIVIQISNDCMCAKCDTYLNYTWASFDWFLISRDFHIVYMKQIKYKQISF